MSHTQSGCLISRTFPGVNIGAYRNTRANNKLMFASSKTNVAGKKKQRTGRPQTSSAIEVKDLQSYPPGIPSSSS
jgi:hypothetical protein